MKPPESFVPLTAAPAPAALREFRVAVLSNHTHAPGEPAAPEHASPKTGFQSLETPKAMALANAAGAEKKIGEPRVTLERDGDRVTHLRIQCGCGQVIELACVYDPPAGK